MNEMKPKLRSNNERPLSQNSARQIKLGGVTMRSKLRALLVTFVLAASFVLFASKVFVSSQGLPSLKVIVTNQNDNPIVGARVCVVTSVQTIATDTNQSGEVSIPTQVGLFNLHIFKEGFVTLSQQVSVPDGANAVRTFALVPGTATALPSGCGMFGTAVPGNSCPRVNDFQVVGGTNTTNPHLTLRATFDRPPRAYRIREFTDAERNATSSFDPASAFRQFNVPWRLMPQNALLPLSNALQIDFNLADPNTFGTHVIYLQVAEVALEDPGTKTIVDAAGCVSSPKSVSVVLAPTNLKTYTLTGTALETFIQQARDRGYRFEETEDKINFKNQACTNEAMVKLPDGAERAPNFNEAVEILRGRFEVFIGPDLNPFWKLKSIDAVHVDFPPTYFADFAGREPAQVVTKEITGSGGPNSIRRIIQWRRSVYPILVAGQVTFIPPKFHSNAVYCVARSPNGADLTEVKLEGPDGKNPIDALPLPH